MFTIVSNGQTIVAQLFSTDKCRETLINVEKPGFLDINLGFLDIKHLKTFVATIVSRSKTIQ